jgi:hypothetical protein
MTIAINNLPQFIRIWVATSVRVIRFAVYLATALLFSAPANAADINGEWRLSITGNSLFFFGTRMLTAGVKQDWEVVIDFQVTNNQFDIGTGNARLIGPPVPYSNPEGMFDCVSIEGIYLDRGLHEVSTPHLRYAGFPVAGLITNGQLQLKPDIEYIGNFLAMMYECSTTDTLGEVWHDRGRLSSLERSKRQDAKLSVEQDRYSVSVKELQFVEPRGEFELPLHDGLKIRQTDQASYAVRTYRLTHVK